MSRGKRQQEEELEEDEVYQYPKTDSGTVFAAIENILRCAICREVSEPPVSLPCCQQAFCSLCIRLYLDRTKPRCPICRGDAAQNQLVVSKELRSVCSTWKRHRKAIVSAAKAAAVGAEVVGPTITEGLPERRQGAGAGQRRDGGRLRGVHYHSTKDGKMRELLRSLGLPAVGDKAAMVARHKRLVLLDAASNDREAPLPRSELIRQVLSWERERKHEKAAAAAASRNLLPRPSSSLSSPAVLPERVRLAQELPGDGEGGEGGDKEDPQPIEKIPKSMQDGFKALIARAKAAQKRKASCSSVPGTDDSVSKRPRFSQGLDRGGDDRGARGTAQKNDTVANGVSPGRPADMELSGSFMSPLSVDGTVGDGSITTTPPTGPSWQARKSLDIPGSSSTGVVVGTDKTRILGVAGRMVRTPWRCVFSAGKQITSDLRKSRGTADATSGIRDEIRPDCPDMKADDCPGDARVGVAEERVDISALPSSRDAADVRDDVSGAMGDGQTPTMTKLGEIETVSNKSEMDEIVRGAAGKCGDIDDERDDDDGFARGADLVAPEGLGLIYLNSTTGETARDPPPELVARAEEAEEAGEYLVFIPSRVFLASVMNAQFSAPSLTVTPSMTEASERATLVVDATAEANRGRESAHRRIAVGLMHDQGRALTTPEPLAAADAGYGRIAGQGVDAWDRLLAASQGGTPLSQPLAAMSADPDWSATASTDAHSATANPALGHSVAKKSSMSKACVTSPLTIDLSQRLSKLSPTIVGDGKTRDGVDVSASAGKTPGFVEITGADGTGPGQTQGKWACTVCTLENRERARVCAACLTPKANPSESKNGSRLRLPTRRNRGDNASQSVITSFASRSGGGGMCNVGGVSDEIPAADGAVGVASASARLTSTAIRAGFPTVRSAERSFARSGEKNRKSDQENE